MSGWLAIGPCLQSSGYTLWSTGNPRAASWSGTVTCAGISGECHRGRIEADSNAGTGVASQASGTAQICINTGGGGCGCDLQDEGGGFCPIVLNPGGGPWRLTGAEDPVAFDLDADGYAERIGWTAADSALAFLALDLNENGSIDDGAELFGVGTRVPGGERAANGFEALRQYDANGDDVLDHADPVWPRLLLWSDIDHDARSAGSELRPLSGSAITALELGFHGVHRRDSHGNSLRYAAHSRVASGRKLFYDIFFVRAD